MSILAVLLIAAGAALLAAYGERTVPTALDTLLGWIPLNVMWIAGAGLAIFGAVIVLMLGAF